MAQRKHDIRYQILDAAATGKIAVNCMQLTTILWSFKRYLLFIFRHNFWKKQDLRSSLPSSTCEILILKFLQYLYIETGANWCILCSSDPVMKQFLLHLDETMQLGSKFVLVNLDECHLFVQPEVYNSLKVSFVVLLNSFKT